MEQVSRLTYTRWILVFPLGLSGVMYLFHFTGWNQLSTGVLPGHPGWWALAGGAMMIAAAIFIAARRFDRHAAAGIALVLSVFAAAVYAPCLGQGDTGMQISSGINLIKDIVLAAASLAYAGLASTRI